MLTLRKSSDRGHADHGWLQSFHSFSFAEYYDPRHMGWGNLRVINDDRVAPGTGFGMHGHRDMEIITYMLAGTLTHQDSMGHTRTIRPGEVQRMSAGRGVMHSEFNRSAHDTVHLLQIWILPRSSGIEPGYEQKTFDDTVKRGRLCLVASSDAAHGSVHIHADARLYAGQFDGAEHATLPIDPARKVYVHLARGTLAVNGQTLHAGDAVLVESEPALELSEGRNAEALVFDLTP